MTRFTLAFLVMGVACMPSPGPGKFQCGNEFCDIATEYCHEGVTQFSSSYSCYPFRDGCDAGASRCRCTGECDGPFQEECCSVNDVGATQCRTDHGISQCN